MTGSTQPMIPTIPRKMASPMITYESISVSAFVRIVLEVDVAPGVHQFVVFALEGAFVLLSDDFHEVVVPADKLTQAYLMNPNKLNDKRTDYAKAKELLGN